MQTQANGKEYGIRAERNALHPETLDHAGERANLTGVHGGPVRALARGTPFSRDQPNPNDDLGNRTHLERSEGAAAAGSKRAA